jgi:subtilisin family serine protease
MFRNRIIPLVLLGILLAACGTSPATKAIPTQEAKTTTTSSDQSGLPAVQIARHPAPVDASSINTNPSIPRYDPTSTDPWQIDFRSANLTKLNLSKSKEDLLYADFDSKTQWPAADKMPADFDWQKIMETGKNPGLGMQILHQKGITGKGVGIAIIDQTLLVDHVEYKDQIRVYEEGEDITGGWMETQMHGPAVASIAVGKTVGVAPQADLYYIATGDCGGANSIEDFDFSCDAKAIRRIIEINRSLPEGRKIRVLSESVGWVPQNKGYDEITAAVNEARAAGIFVISSSLQEIYGLRFHGLGRNPLADPDQFTSYEPGLWWNQQFFAGKANQQGLMVPMDSRTTASPTGVADYVFYRTGGWSWSIPYLAGTYALAVQVKPEITPEEFWKLAIETGKTIQVQHEGKTYPLGVILDPQALIAALQK